MGKDLTDWLRTHPLVRTVAVLSAAAGLLMVAVEYRWHVSDERAQELQERWLAQDREWNNEIISRLQTLEAVCGEES